MALDPSYVSERRRLLSNAACFLRCARQYAPVARDGGAGFLSARKAEQRVLARLRGAWRPSI